MNYLLRIGCLCAALALVGCGGGDIAPVTVDANQEQELVAAQKQVDAEERAQRRRR